MILIERSGNADDDGIHLFQAGVIRGGFEALGAGVLNFAGQDADNVSATLGEGGNFALINIEAGHAHLLLGKQQGEGQTDVAQTDNGDARLTFFNPGFEFRNSGGGGYWRSCHLGNGFRFRILTRW